jgi:hypothetical protein
MILTVKRIDAILSTILLSYKRAYCNKDNER